MILKARLQSDANDALRAGNKPRLSVLRLALAAVKQIEVDSREELDDSGVETVIQKMIKQGNEAAQQFREAGRNELASKERAEIAVLEEYLPEPLEAEELEALISDCISAVSAASIKDMGRVMAAIKAAAGNQVDMGAVSKRVRQALDAG